MAASTKHATSTTFIVRFFFRLPSKQKKSKLKKRCLQTFGNLLERDDTKWKTRQPYFSYFQPYFIFQRSQYFYNKIYKPPPPPPQSKVIPRGGLGVFVVFHQYCMSMMDGDFLPRIEYNSCPWLRVSDSRSGFSLEPAKEHRIQNKKWPKFDVNFYFISEPILYSGTCQSTCLLYPCPLAMKEKIELPPPPWVLVK